MKTVKVQVDPKTGDGFLNLEDFKDFVDITKVKSYELIPGDKSLVVKFFDENQKQLPTKKN